HAVQDADQTIAAAACHAVEPKTKLRSANFLRIFAAHGGQIIRVDNSGFQIVDAAEIFESAGMKCAAGNPHAVDDVASKDALVTDVVNGEDDWDILDQGIFGVRGVQQHGQQAGLP